MLKHKLYVWPLPIRLTMWEQPQAGASIPFLVHEAGLPLTCPIPTIYFRFISQEQVRSLQCYFIHCSSSFPLEKARRAGEEGKPLVQWSQEFPIHSMFCICTSLQETQTQIHFRPWISTVWHTTVSQGIASLLSLHGTIQLNRQKF